MTISRFICAAASFLCKITYFPGFFHWKMVLETKTCSNLLIIEAHLFTQAKEG